MQQKTNSHQYTSLMIIIAAALLVRLFFLKFEYAAGWDEINYLKLGASGAIHGIGQVLHPYWSPLYPFAIAVMGKICPDYELAGRLVSIFFGTLLIVPIYFFSLKNFNRRTAIINALLIAFFPALIVSSVAAETEPLYIFITITGILLGFYAVKHRSNFGAAIVGILFALAYLTRPEGIGLYFVFSGIIAGVAIWEIFKYHQFKSALLLVPISLGFFMASAPYLYYLKQTTGQWTISSKGSANLQGGISAMQNAKQNIELNPWLLLSEDNTSLPDDNIYHTGEFMKKSALLREGNNSEPIVTVTPGLVIKKFVKNFLLVIQTGIAQVLGLPILMLLALGFWGSNWDKNHLLRESYLLSYVIFYWFLLVPMFHFTERYMLPMVPIALMWSGAGIENVKDWFEKTWEAVKPNLKKSAMVMLRNAFLFIFVGSLFIPAYIRVIARNPYEATEWAEPIEQKQAGVWLKNYCGNEVPVVMSWSHAISFYAGNYDIKQSITIPNNELDRALAYARYRGAKFLALNEKNKKSFPTLSYLLDESQSPSDLKLIYKDDSMPGLKTLIYEILPERDRAVNRYGAEEQSNIDDRVPASLR